jgi:hypothetical protein
MSIDEKNIAISYYIEEIENENNNFDIEELMNKFENVNLNQHNLLLNNELIIPQIMNYNENYNIKELLLICDYYGFAKKLKYYKYKKEEIIKILVTFELNPQNNDIVNKRQNMWFYINELKNDKFMKKYVLWL